VREARPWAVLFNPFGVNAGSPKTKSVALGESLRKSVLKWGVITTHILDTAHGRPAAGVSARLEVQEADGWREIGAGVTNEDGRIADLGPDKLQIGNYRIEVDVGAYYRQTETSAFFSTVCLSFTVGDPAEHYHVPLLISPFAISTYRGS
jgi:5-hydroxyisourate hydrolase